MDLADRIKIFINYLSIGSSQFADNCKIPRPTLSQILNGRNKKISDEIIGKIHNEYPALSVVWLMFGEGEMLVGSNNQMSEPQEGAIIDFANNNNVYNQQFTTVNKTKKNVTDLGSEKLEGDIFSNLSPISAEEGVRPEETRGATPSTATDSNQIKLNLKGAPSGTAGDTSARRIVNIMVFYNDNSFETFTPACWENQGQ